MSENHVSRRLKQEAADKINAKLAILTKWVCGGIPVIPRRPGPKTTQSKVMQLDYFPDDEKAFCAWTAQQNCTRTVERFPELLEIKSLSRSTIVQPAHVLLRDRVSDVLDALTEKAKAQLTISEPATKLADVIADRDRWKAIAEKQETDVRDQRAKAAEAEAKYRAERRARMQNDAALNEQIQSLSAEVSALTATLKKVTSFRSTGKLK
ncbi:hypothetical protein PQQ51_19540 [Paraburkholderia xenovorans]|uniref:hypothetical protein n=1 Tax=Paraburkholderia xenovorans TaxID=36873 RepID=UPI0038B8BA38